MKNKGCVNQGCTGCLWIFIYLIIFVIVISGLGFFGLSIGIIGAVLAYTSPAYREWLKNQRGFQSRLSKLPGMASSSPTALALSTLAYTVPLSLISWSFLLGSFGKTDTTITAGIMGLIGLVLLFGWFIKGWGIPSAVTPQQGQTVNKVQETQYFKRIRQLDEIRQLDPVAFERFIGSLFEKMGYQVQTTPLSGDEGIDLVLRKDTKLAIVQCKRYENSVGQPVVRDLYGAMVHNKADEAYLVTTGTVTLPAQQWIVGKPLHLVDGNTLVEWIETFKEHETSQPTNVNTHETNNLKVRREGIIGNFRRNPIASIAIPIALILPLCCCLVGTWVSPIVITPTPTPTPITPTPTKLPSTATLVPTHFPTQTLTPTTTPDAIQEIRDRLQNPKLMLYDEYTSIQVLLDNEILKISVTRKSGDLWDFESLQDISSFLHLALVDCTEYRFGHGIDGCSIKETAPYKFVELREYMSSGELKAYVRFTVGDRKYYFGYDGTRIIESQLFELADESFLQP